MTLTTSKTSGGKVDHIVRPISLQSLDTDMPVAMMCGKRLVNNRDVKHFDNVERAIAECDMCSNCLVAIGKETPHVSKNEQRN